MDAVVQGVVEQFREWAPRAMENTELVLEDRWVSLSPEERAWLFEHLPHTMAEEFFSTLEIGRKVDLLRSLSQPARKLWMRLLPPDDAADVVQAAPEEEREELVALLDAVTAAEVRALLAYAEDDAGGLMNPRYARLRPDQTVAEAINYLQRQTRQQVESVYYLFVLDAQQHLLGVASFRDLFSAPSHTRVRDVMSTDVVSVPDDMDQEEVSKVLARHQLLAVPVVDAENRMRGVVTVQDVVDVMQEEATEDIQKLGATEALDRPYLDIGFFSLVRKRAVWLAVLFIGQMFTATAMGYFEDELARALVLALFIPLIISSGGNCGSQASTLVIRAMALGEVRLHDWWRVMGREVAVGLSLGMFLGLLGLLRVVYWPNATELYGQHYTLIGMTVGLSVVGVVLYGAVVGAMLPFLLRKLNLDPASASAPFVATVVDVSGLVIYFSVAHMLLRGVLL